MIPRSRTWLVLLIGLLVAGPASAETSEELMRDLRDENQALRDQLQDQEQRIAALETGPRNTPVAAGSSNAAVRSKIPIRIGGFIKVDSFYQSARMNSTDAPRFVSSDPDRNDGQFGSTVQHSRLTLSLDPVDVRSAKLSGLVELDFFSLGDIGDSKFNNNQLRTRQLYLNLEQDGWSLLMGQTWDLFSPLNPTTLNTNGFFWFGGNAGFRRPQLRITKRFEGEDSALVAAASLNSNIGQTITVGGTTRNTGEDAGTPVLEGLLTYEFRLGQSSGQIGFSALAGEEEDDVIDEEIAQYWFGVHAQFKPLDWVSLQGEWQIGKNLDAFLAGAGYRSAAGPGAGKEIKSTSGWLQLALRPFERVRVNLHYSLENLYDPDPATGRSNNRIIGGNAYYDFGEGLEFGVEWDYFATRFSGSENADGNLVWLSAIYGF